MWANAHRDGHWPTFFKCGQIQVAPSVQRREVLLMPTTRVPCSNAAKTRNPLNLAGVPLTITKRSQPLVDRSSSYCNLTWERYCCLTTFSDYRYIPQLRRYSIKNIASSHKVVRWCPDGEFLVIFLRVEFTASRVQHISDLHFKFALGPRHV